MLLTPPPSVPASSDDAPPPVRTRAAADVAVVAAAAALTFVAASRLELAEAFNRWLHRYESWQADELPFVLLVLALGLAWYALRRRGEARRALRLHEQGRRQVAQLLARNRHLAQQLIGLQESERAALARELHDELGQRCTAMRIEAALVEGAVQGRGLPAGGDAAAEVGAAAHRIAANAQALHELVRGMLRRLRPPQLDELGLVDALQALCESWETTSGVACVLHHEGRFDDLPDAAGVAVYRIAQEALSNVMRHARARTARVRLLRGADGALTLQVRDDGGGMPALPQGSEFPPLQGLGLLGASERAAVLGGTLHVDSWPWEGTTLTLQLPAGAGRAAAPPAEAAAEPAVAVPAGPGAGDGGGHGDGSGDGSGDGGNGGRPR
jgi:signal transduction histidine kinase